MSWFLSGFASEIQKLASEPVKRTVNFDGLECKIQQNPGDVREGVGEGGKPWKKLMKHSYGYIPKTKGADGMAVDIYLARDPVPGSRVFIVKQLKHDGSYDEDKVMLGFPGREDAKLGYLAHMKPQRLGGIQEISRDEFERYIDQHAKAKARFRKRAFVMPGGVADRKGIRPSDVDQQQLRMGERVEKEHTRKPVVAKAIATDHLSEIPKYYSYLRGMEDRAKKRSE